MKTHPNTIEALERLVADRVSILMPLNEMRTEINLQTLADIVEDVKTVLALQQAVADFGVDAPWVRAKYFGEIAAADVPRCKICRGYHWAADCPRAARILSKPPTAKEVL